MRGNFDLMIRLHLLLSIMHLAIGKDATRVISRVEYDSETDQCVGFVLPVNKLGLPKVDSFLAISLKL